MHNKLSSTARLWLLLAGAPVAANAAVIGHMTPPPPVTEARIAALPAARQAPWRAYLAHSRALAAADKAALAAERAAGADGAAPADPPEGRNGGAGMPLDRPADWYGSPEARHVADEIVSFQTPAGGWGKNVDRSGPLRKRGQNWVATGNSYVGTIDNDATTTELRFLARVPARPPPPPRPASKAAPTAMLLSAACTTCSTPSTRTAASRKSIRSKAAITTPSPSTTTRSPT
jgi:hypothetical protein